MLQVSQTVWSRFAVFIPFLKKRKEILTRRLYVAAGGGAGPGRGEGATEARGAGQETPRGHGGGTQTAGGEGRSQVTVRDGAAEEQTEGGGATLVMAVSCLYRVGL